MGFILFTKFFHAQFSNRGRDEGYEMVGRIRSKFRNDGHLYGHQTVFSLVTKPVSI